MSSVRVIRGGMLTTIQDSGRWGYQSRGVPVAGPMDPVSHRLANALVGNDRGAANRRLGRIHDVAVEGALQYLPVSPIWRNQC